MKTHENDQQGPRATILIVEDHKSVRNALRDWLSISFPDCRVLDVESGEEAVALVRVHPPDIVLMDIGLPQMNGIQATRNIKAITPLVHVVMLTIQESFAYEAEAVEAGAHAYILKRKMGTDLIPAVAALLRLSSDTGGVM